MKPSVAIIGGGASALFFASQIDSLLYDVQIFEHKKTLGRKLLVAGDGGFNLTHSAPVNELVNKYIPTNFFNEKIIQFDNNYFRNYLNGINVPTFIGSSKRVFPEPPIKPVAVLNELLTVIQQKGIKINTLEKWLGWSEDYKKLRFTNEINEHVEEFDHVVFCMGGQSWQKTGSDGQWNSPFINAGIKCNPFKASNCEMFIHWPDNLATEHAGTPLKNIQVSSNQQKIKGELVLTKNGIEGNAIYALSEDIRNELAKNELSTIYLDLKPGLSSDKIIEKLNGFKKGNWTSFIKQQLKLTKVNLALIQANSDKLTYTTPDKLAQIIKNIPLKIYALGPIDDAISTVGGVDLKEVNENFELINLPNHYVIGEMLDWDAPTGGFLLQGCFTMGTHLSHYFNNKTAP